MINKYLLVFGVYSLLGNARLIRLSETDNDAEEELSAYLGWLTDGTIGDDIDGSINDKASCLDSVNKLDTNRGGRDGLLGQMQGIFELDAECNVILQGRIGQGFYGEVYRGTLERDNAKDSELQQVAVKKLKTRALEADIRDFEREIAIMKVSIIYFKYLYYNFRNFIYKIFLYFQ